MTEKKEEATPEMVTITKGEYDTLCDDQFKLQCLENGGVDNWTWYGESMKPYWKERRFFEEEE